MHINCAAISVFFQKLHGKIYYCIIRILYKKKTPGLQFTISFIIFCYFLKYKSKKYLDLFYLETSK